MLALGTQPHSSDSEAGLVGAGGTHPSGARHGEPASPSPGKEVWRLEGAGWLPAGCPCAVGAHLAWWMCAAEWDGVSTVAIVCGSVVSADTLEVQAVGASWWVLEKHVSRGAEAQLPRIPAVMATQRPGDMCVPRPLHMGSQAVVGVAELMVGLFLPSMCTCLLPATGRQGTAAQPGHHWGQPGLGVPACGGPTVRGW